MTGILGSVRKVARNKAETKTSSGECNTEHCVGQKQRIATEKYSYNKSRNVSQIIPVLDEVH